MIHTKYILNGDMIYLIVGDVCDILFPSVNDRIFVNGGYYHVVRRTFDYDNSEVRIHLLEGFEYGNMSSGDGFEAIDKGE